MKFFKKSSKSTVQRFFVVAAVSLWAISVVDLIGNIALQYPFNSDAAAYIFIAMVTIIMPVLIALALYFSRRRRKISLDSVFDITVVTAGVSALLVVAVYLLNQLVRLPAFDPIMRSAEDSSSLLVSILATIPLLTTLVVLYCMIRKLRQTSDW